MSLGRTRRIESRDDYTEIGMRSGAYGYITKVLTDGMYVVAAWEPCRDEFHDRFRKQRLIAFCHGPGLTRNIAAFIGRVEEMVRAVPRTVVGPTQFTRVSYLRVSSWWRKDAMRRSLFTAMLRAARCYRPEDDNFDEALQSVRYTRQTLPAVRRFLDGYTKYTGKVVGWNNQFFHGGRAGRYHRPPSCDEINRLLVRPRHEASEGR